MDDDAEIIYDLQLLDEEADNQIGTVMVSNQHPRRLELDPRRQSWLNMQTLQFNPYSASQLEAILEKRVEQAFRPGTVEDDVVQRIAEKVAESGGDCRQALEFLLRLGGRADRNGESEVSADDL